MKNECEISGIIYPLNENNYNNLKKREKPIYVKFLTHTNSKNPTKLQKGHYLLFYISNSTKSVAGYSQIVDILFKLPIEIKKNFINQIQMDKNEFTSYIKDREAKPLIILVLNKIIDLKKEKHVSYPITMTGKYLLTNELNQYIKL